MLLHFFFFLFALPLTMALGNFQGAVTNNTAKPDCLTHCGNITIPYPFGIGTDCYLDHKFNLTCNTSNNEIPKLFLGEEKNNIRIYNISDSEMRIFTQVSYRCYDQRNMSDDEFTSWTTLGTPKVFKFSEKNRFMVIGCDEFALITGAKEDDFTSGCFGLCQQPPNVSHGQCSGAGCCQISLPKGLTYYNVVLGSLQNHSDVWSFNKCGYGFLVEEGNFQFSSVDDLSTDRLDIVNRIESTIAILLDWVIAPNGSCAAEVVNECKENSSCYNVEGGGYRCKCNEGYEGNPYLHPGCQDINECNDVYKYPCYGICTNTLGSYNCTCPLRFFGEANTTNGCQRVGNKDSKIQLTIFIIAMLCGMLALLSGIAGICIGVRRRKLTKLREKFFEQNGGVLLQQKIKLQGSHEAMTLFSTEQLRKATNNYSQEKIIGKGAYGVVYRRVLLDKRVVAIKKSKLVDTTQAEQFINEVMILTQVIHRNVVKLLGCCLEEEIPILVYEFISNNTLFHHIHHRLGGMSWLSWENRLRVATEAASALAYLHSEITMPIVHRDVKSTNILLDENYTAKILDFGASRLVPLDHDQVTTLIQGTLGYLDPEYFNSSQLTEKSDVYSFGVVLVELITGKKPIGANRTNEEKNLATYFVNSVKGNRLFEIVEPRLLREGTFEQLQALGDLVKRCLRLVGHDRPTMKEIAMELDSLRKFTTHPWAQQQTYNETRSLALEVEQSDLYEVPLIHGTNEWESYPSITNLALEENNPR
ncbi:wall-associated receptor kinase 2-like [Bidens hawaiensis]|uniref:wall-associated receptor kinase 2-like n=1 Tax=Bidens hawaiensis TaxID=980011 RepID=UPI00404AF9F7